MAQAQVRSTAALYEFRGALLEFASVAHQALDMIGAEARRGVDWLVVDRVRHWKNENRKAWDAVSRAKDAVHQARIQRTIADHIPDCIDEKKALARAEAHLKLTEKKLAAVQHWGREIQHAYNEFEGRFSQAHSAMDGNLPSAVAALERIIRQLDEYYRLLAPALERLPSDVDVSASGDLLSGVQLPSPVEPPAELNPAAATTLELVAGPAQLPMSDEQPPLSE